MRTALVYNHAWTVHTKLKVPFFMNPSFLLLLLFVCVQGELKGKLKSIAASISAFRRTPSASSVSSVPAQKTLTIPESSDNPDVLAIKAYRDRFDKMVAAILEPIPTEPVIATPCLVGGCPRNQSFIDINPSYSEANLDKDCMNAISKAYGTSRNGNEFKSHVLQVLGRGVGAKKVVNEAVATLAANLTASFGLEADKILLPIVSKVFNGFCQAPVSKEEYNEMRDEAIRLVGKDEEVIAFANSEEMTRSLRSMGFSSCTNLEALSNLVALLSKYTNFQNLSRTTNKEVWAAVFATILKMTLEAKKNGEPYPEQQIFLFFYKKGRFAEVYANLYKKVDFRKTYQKSFFYE